MSLLYFVVGCNKPHRNVILLSKYPPSSLFTIPRKCKHIYTRINYFYQNDHIYQQKYLYHKQNLIMSFLISVLTILCILETEEGKLLNCMVEDIDIHFLQIAFLVCIWIDKLVLSHCKLCQLKITKIS